MIYAGITVGPIVGTLSMTSTPAGLWAASYFFSSLVRDICEALQAREAAVLTLPEGFQVREHRDEYRGIGRYHDRVYFMMDRETAEVEAQLQGARDEAVRRSAEALGTALRKSADEAEAFLKKYLQIHYVIVPEEETKAKGLAKTLADALDAMELAEHAQGRQAANLFLDFLRDESNDCLKNYPPLVDAVKAGDFALARGDEGDISLTDLPRIARGDLIPSDAERTRRGKTGKYFAIVQGDGDNMGQLLATSDGMEEKERIQQFSTLCMDYTATALRQVQRFGGAMIYAGGDDLLFLAPVIGAGGKTVWELCRELDGTFRNAFAASAFSKQALPVRPSMSFGVSIEYVKYPLYEAFADAQTRLFGDAKRPFDDKDFTGLPFTEKERKNNLAVRVLKHSGQASGFIASLQSETLTEFFALLDAFFKNDGKGTDKANQAMHSVLYHVENEKALFAAAMDDPNAGQTLGYTFRNAFDNAGQVLAREQNEAVARLAAAIVKDYKDYRVRQIGEEDASYSRLYTLTAMLRVAKLLAEGGKARE
ncbi:MAG: hypothetical protein K6E38_08105 [Fretibacterium sp.]|nr:hypothetical protein [Fretibacterium sp.]